MDAAEYQPQFNVHYAVINENTVAVNEIVPLREGYKARVLQITLVCSGAVTLTFKSGSTPISGPMSFAANSGLSTPLVPVGLMETNIGEALNLDQSSTAVVGGSLVYIWVR